MRITDTSANRVADLQNTNQYYTWPQDLQSGIIFMDTKTGEISRNRTISSYRFREISGEFGR